MTAVTVAAAARTRAGEQVGAEQPLWEYVRASGMRAVVMGASKDPNAKVTLVLVSAETGRETLVIKAPTSEPAARAVEAEERALRAVGSASDGEIAQTIPRVVEVLAHEAGPALVMTAVTGVPMTTAYLEPRHTRSPERVARDFDAVDRWLTAFQDGTAEEWGPLEMVAGVADRLQERFEDEADLDADLRRLAEIGARLATNHVPRTAVHGDLWFGNILVADGRVSGVVDWEAGAVGGGPTRDLVRFAHMYALYLDLRTRPGRRVRGHRGLRADCWGAGVEYAIDGEGWFPDLYRGFLTKGLARLGAAPDVWREAALAGVAEIAAFTDEPVFARRHLHLFRRLARHQSERKERRCRPAAL
jgi:aminoglycoside phosphotransferase (APT) family kinase protein